MKRKLKKMSLRTETLLSLQAEQLRRAGGADPSDNTGHADFEDSQTCSYGVHEGTPIIVYV